jgi:hypothetical protein
MRLWVRDAWVTWQGFEGFGPTSLTPRWSLLPIMWICQVMLVTYVTHSFNTDTAIWNQVILLTRIFAPTAIYSISTVSCYPIILMIRLWSIPSSFVGHYLIVIFIQVVSHYPSILLMIRLIVICIASRYPSTLPMIRLWSSYPITTHHSSSPLPTYWRYSPLPTYPTDDMTDWMIRLWPSYPIAICHSS